MNEWKDETGRSGEYILCFTETKGVHWVKRETVEKSEPQRDEHRDRQPDLVS